MTPNDIVLRSDEVNEIFSKMPSNMVRWGNTWILLIMIGLIVLSYFVKYPDIITGNVVLTNNAAPVVVVCPSNGKLKLEKENYSSVSVGQRLGYITEDATIEHIDTLYKYLKYHDIDKIIVEDLPPLELGKLQSIWSRFVIDFRAYRVYNNIKPEQIGIISTQQQIAHNKKSATNLSEQIEMKQEQLNFYSRKLAKDRQLLEKGMIAEREYQNTQLQYNDMLNQIKSLSSQHISLDKSNADYHKQIADYKISKTQTESQKLTELMQQRITILEELELWYKNNTFQSPIEGKLQYNQALSNSQFVTQGMELFTITPAVKQKIKCNMTVPKF